MLIDTVYVDDAGQRHHRLDRGPDRRLIVRYAETELPPGSRVLATIVVNEGDHDSAGSTPGAA